MRFSLTSSCILLIIITITSNLILVKSSNHKRLEYTNEFAVHIDAPSDQVDSIAQENGFINRGQVSTSDAVPSLAIVHCCPC
jgi:cupin superfamily acireductone dioxygenase involved in methionine salvage